MGNSSSIIKEAPYFNCYHINIGQRQMKDKRFNAINISANTEDVIRTVEDIIKNKDIQPVIDSNPYSISIDPVEGLCGG